MHLGGSFSACWKMSRHEFGAEHSHSLFPSVPEDLCTQETLSRERLSFFERLLLYVEVFLGLATQGTFANVLQTVCFHLIVR